MSGAGRTPPGVRELKLSVGQRLKLGMPCRTPPGVRELKLMYSLSLDFIVCRTPPGVRELKLSIKCFIRLS